jgi:4-hydroxythreonine-4-phosphate dehydrogenase
MRRLPSLNGLRAFEAAARLGSFVAAGEEIAPIRFGEIAPEAGRFAYLAIERAVELAQAGRIDAIVTAPLNKEALNLAGYRYAGHTDMLAALTHTRSSVMLLAHGDMRVGHVTTHVALADVADGAHGGDSGHRDLPREGSESRILLPGRRADRRLVVPAGRATTPRCQ